MKLAERLSSGRRVVTAWSSLPSVDLAEALARTRYDAVTLDMQHGGHSEASVYEGVARIALAGKPAIVRIPVGRNDMASRALDFGAEAVIAPMINSCEEARAFAAAAKFPPLGARSWGPTRALQVHGGMALSDYLAKANTLTLALAMIETRTALAALPDILAVGGIDGVFLGPSDFSISWTEGRTVDPELADMQPTIEEVLAAARAAGKQAGVFAVSPEWIAAYDAMGFSLIAGAADGAVVARGAEAMLSALKSEA